MPRTKKEINKYLILRDVQEKANFWTFSKSKYCDGTVEKHLVTGDYTIDQMSHIFSIERKATTGELAGNVFTKQFENELKRGNKLRHFFVICTFSLKDVLNFPYDSGIPRGIWPKLKVTSQALLKKIIEFECKYNVRFIFANDNETAKEVARSIFKRMIELYNEEKTNT